MRPRDKLPSSLSITVSDIPIMSVSKARDLGVIIQDDLSMKTHINNMCKSAAMGLRMNGKIRHLLNRSTTVQRDSCTHLWLLIRARIQFKVLTLVCKCLHGNAPAYLSKLIKQYHPSRNLRSQSKNLLSEIRVKSKTFGDRAFL